MPKPPPEDPVIPPQDVRICGTICICQMTAVLSSVALVYLSVAIYMPSMRAFESGIIETPVICTTIRNITNETCIWGSCGEWCLSKSTGACNQIYVMVRENGTNILFQNCTNSAEKECYGIDSERAQKARCNKDECKSLTGQFNCTKGQCLNLTEILSCEFTQKDPPLVCSGRRGKINCIEMDGLFDCNRGLCRRVRGQFNCDRRCIEIPTRNKNVIVLSGNKAYLTQCKRAVVMDQNKEILDDKEVWTDKDKPIIASCISAVDTPRGVEAEDCINGTFLDVRLPDFVNYTHLQNTHHSMENRVDATGEYLKMEHELVIANETGLMINLEGCVNTLRGECKEFASKYGRDGTDHNAKARFPCYYSPNNLDHVITHFDLETVWKEFLVASLIPSCLFVVSCFTLLCCVRSVEVGDDARFRFKACSGGDADAGNEGGDQVMAL